MQNSVLLSTTTTTELACIESTVRHLRHVLTEISIVLLSVLYILFGVTCVAHKQMQANSLMDRTIKDKTKINDDDRSRESSSKEGSAVVQSQ